MTAAPARYSPPAWRQAMTVDWPESKYGSASLRRFEVTEDAARWEMVRSVFSGGRGCSRPGTYTSLYVNGTMWMSDTPDEQHDHSQFLRRLGRDDSRVLVNGLGLGMVVRALCHFESVREIDVCDNHADVVALIGPLVKKYGAEQGKTVTVWLGDAHEPAATFPKGARWDAVWHDIWPDICVDNWESMKTLRRRYGRRCGMQDVWCGRETERLVRQDRECARWSW